LSVTLPQLHEKQYSLLSQATILSVNGKRSLCVDKVLGYTKFALWELGDLPEVKFTMTFLM